jgi:hypothetical protein
MGGGVELAGGEGEGERGGGDDVVMHWHTMDQKAPPNFQSCL